MRKTIYEFSDSIVYDSIISQAREQFESGEEYKDCESVECAELVALEGDGGTTYDIIRDSEIDYFKGFFSVKNITGYWKMKSDNLGWNKLTGYKTFEANKVEEFIEEVTPKYEHSIRIYRFRNGFEITVSSHDSPMGQTMYVTPIEKSTYEKI